MVTSFATANSMMSRSRYAATTQDLEPSTRPVVFLVTPYPFPESRSAATFLNCGWIIFGRLIHQDLTFRKVKRSTTQELTFYTARDTLSFAINVLKRSAWQQMEVSPPKVATTDSLPACRSWSAKGATRRTRNENIIEEDGHASFIGHSYALTTGRGPDTGISTKSNASAA